MAIPPEWQLQVIFISFFYACVYLLCWEKTDLFEEILLLLNWSIILSIHSRFIRHGLVPGILKKKRKNHSSLVISFVKTGLSQNTGMVKFIWCGAHNVYRLSVEVILSAFPVRVGIITIFNISDDNGLCQDS